MFFFNSLNKNNLLFKLNRLAGLVTVLTFTRVRYTYFYGSRVSSTGAGSTGAGSTGAGFTGDGSTGAVLPSPRKPT